MSKDCIFIFLTESCNLSCEHCYVTAYPGKGISMSDKTFEQALKFSKDCGISDIRFTGGEATIHPKFGEYLEVAHEMGFQIGLVSNGLKLLRYGDRVDTVLQKLSRCWISLYALDSDMHQDVGGVASASIDRLLAFVGANVSKGHQIGISVVVHPGEVELAEDFLNRCIVEGVNRVRFIPWQPDGRGVQLHQGFDFEKYRLEIKMLHQCLLDFLDRWDWAQLSVNDPFDLENNYEPACDSCLLKARKMWSVTPDGSIYSCCFNAYDGQHKIASLREDRLAHILDNPMLVEQTISRCRGLERKFWLANEEVKVTCPIGAIALK